MTTTPTTSNEEVYVSARRHTQQLVDISIHRIQEDGSTEVLDEYTVDFNLPPIRMWFSRTVVWATCHGYGIQVSKSKHNAPDFYPRDRRDYGRREIGSDERDW